MGDVPARLVLVEELPGSGKSTTAQWLTRQWRARGRAARWIHGQQPRHSVCGIPPGLEYEPAHGTTGTLTIHAEDAATMSPSGRVSSGPGFGS